MLLLLVMPAGPAAGVPLSPKVGAEVLAQLDVAQTAEVLVMLRERTTSNDLLRRRRAVRAAQQAVLATVRAEDIRVGRRFALISGFTATVTPAGLAALLATGDVLRVDGPRRGSGAAAQNVEQIHADAVHARDDLGQGVTVAVLDTGTDVTHPDIAGSVIAEQCFCSPNCCPDGTASQTGPGSALTTFVHGIHVSGTIVSKGIVAPQGIAPAAKVVMVKVLDDSNRGLLSDWISALDWIGANRPDVQAINMSLVSDTLYSGPCDGDQMAFTEIIGVLRARGTLVFAASGNNGNTGKMAAPACVAAAVAIGAVTNRDTVWPGTDRDPTLGLLAPGVAITSTGLDHGTATLTGTSMATAHATGTAALLLAFAPGLDADALEELMKQTGVPIADDRNGVVFIVPRLDAFAALGAELRRSRPLFSGGSKRSGCLMEWDIAGTHVAATRAIGQAVCHDGDPLCDTDDVAAQCTFALTACFNANDRRLPQCPNDAAITATEFASPSAAAPGDAIDAGNATALGRALPPLPVTTADVCTTPIPFVVPAGQTKWIRAVAHAADGRTDYDRLRLSCLPAQP